MFVNCAHVKCGLIIHGLVNLDLFNSELINYGLINHRINCVVVDHILLEVLLLCAGQVNIVQDIF